MEPIKAAKNLATRRYYAFLRIRVATMVAPPAPRAIRPRPAAVIASDAPVLAREEELLEDAFEEPEPRLSFEPELSETLSDLLEFS